MIIVLCVLFKKLRSYSLLVSVRKYDSKKFLLTAKNAAIFIFIQFQYLQVRISMNEFRSPI